MLLSYVVSCVGGIDNSNIAGQLCAFLLVTCVPKSLGEARRPTSLTRLGSPAQFVDRCEKWGVQKVIHLTEKGKAERT